MNLKYSAVILLLSMSCLIPSVQPESCVDKDQQFFLSFHPHLDAFWLNTDDELKDIKFRPEGFLYMMNQRNSKQIFNQMLEGVSANPQRKYFVSEAVFLKDWYDYLPNAKKQKFKELLKNGQIEITNGGWVQSDEAVCYVDDIIDQYTVGHNWLYEEFGEVVKIAWATDSFGHSHSQAAIEHLLGIQSQGIERIDDRYIYERKGGSLLQFYWSAVSDSNGLKYGGVFTYIRHFLHEFINYRQMSATSVANDHSMMIKTMKRLYKRDKFFRFVGNDFEEFNGEDFKRLDDALVELNKDQKGSCSVYKWGNPSEYFNILKSQKQELIQTRQNDFLPNYDQDHYWSGYYTSNPELKIICKEFSRLLNLFRKLLLKHRTNGREDNMKDMLKTADELVSVMQHHDGITATSKYHIEELFKRRMRDSSKDLVEAIGKMTNHQRDKVCQLFKNGNSCELNGLNGDQSYLTILHEGAAKLERVELQLPEGKYYQVEEDADDNVFCPMENGKCKLVFEAALYPGENIFTLKSIEKQSPIVKKQAEGNSLSYSSDKFTLQINENKIVYTLKSGDFIVVSLVRSINQPSSTSTKTWNKFGSPIPKTERRNAGIYIMSNNGQIEPIPEVQFQLLRAVEGKRYCKFFMRSRVANVELTINKKQANQVDVQTSFKPSTGQTFDYFVKIDSPLKSSDHTFYHDVNGFLVSKRKIGNRPDYTWQYKKEDKINANNYPMCSFSYMIEGAKKLLVFTDRAQGVTLFDNSLLVNIDRLTYDDYKGVGEGYMHMINNTYRMKVALLDSDDNHLERIWQRQYDQAHLAFLSSVKGDNVAKRVESGSLTRLKYNIFLLNDNEFVVRLFNLDQKKTMEVPKFSSKSWKISKLGLDFNFTDLKESFANGIPLGERKIWKTIPGEVNIFNAGLKDTDSKLVLEPLQIRSFRVNLHEKIKGHFLKRPNEQLADISITDIKPLGNLFTKRCF